MTLDEAILRNSQPMENNFTAEHLKQIEEARNLSEKQGEAIFKSAKTGQSLENALKGVEQPKKSPGQLRKEAWEEKKELRVKNGLEKIKAIEKQIEERKNKRVQEETAKAEAAQKEAEWWKKLAEEENAQIEAKEANHISENAKNKEVQERLNARTPLKNPDKNETGVNTPKQIKTVEYPPAVASQKGFYVIPKVTGGSKNNPVGISKETQAKYARQNQRMAENGEQLTLFGGVEYPAQTNAGTFPNTTPKASFWSKYKKPEGKVGREITKEEWQKRFRKLGQKIPKEEWEKKYGNKKGSKSPEKDETGINTPKEDKTPQNDHSPSTQNEHSNSPKQAEKAKEKKSSEKPKRNKLEDMSYNHETVEPNALKDLIYDTNHSLQKTKARLERVSKFYAKVDKLVGNATDAKNVKKIWKADDVRNAKDFAEATPEIGNYFTPEDLSLLKDSDIVFTREDIGKNVNGESSPVLNAAIIKKPEAASPEALRKVSSDIRHELQHLIDYQKINKSKDAEILKEFVNNYHDNYYSPNIEKAQTLKKEIDGLWQTLDPQKQKLLKALTNKKSTFETVDNLISESNNIFGKGTKEAELVNDFLKARSYYDNHFLETRAENAATIVIVAKIFKVLKIDLKV